MGLGTEWEAWDNPWGGNYDRTVKPMLQEKDRQRDEYLRYYASIGNNYVPDYGSSAKQAFGRAMGIQAYNAARGNKTANAPRDEYFNKTNPVEAYKNVLNYNKDRNNY